MSLLDSFDSSDELFHGRNNPFAHPDSPAGSGGFGSLRLTSPLGNNVSPSTKLPHPNSPAGKELSTFDAVLAFNSPFHEYGGWIMGLQPLFPTGFNVLKLEKLTNHLPDSIIKQIPQCAEKFQINTPLRLSHFLAQCAHESEGFKVTHENLNYSAAGLKKIFPKYFPEDLADSYARQPKKIAARVYGNRMGNGNEESEDGYKYRGRGYIQLTGKDNYKAFDKTVGDDILSNPDLVSDKYPLLSAAWFWHTCSINGIADQGSGKLTITKVTKKVNGGVIGLPDRISRFKKYYALLA